MYKMASMMPRAIGATAKHPPAVNPDPLPMGEKEQIEGSSIVVFQHLVVNDFRCGMCRPLARARMKKSYRSLQSGQ